MILTISGNLSRYLETEDSSKFTYTFHIVPIAVSVLFGIGIGLPLGIRFVVNFMGTSPSQVPVLHGVGIYCYSFSSFLVSSLFCGFIPLNWLQWMLILYSTLTSVMFLVSTYWADLSTTLDARKRALVVTAICVVQVSLLLVFKLYFFHHVSY